ncbi:MAG: sulfite exporter TauE/SafE family protein [Alkalispirochaeta sp.]
MAGVVLGATGFGFAVVLMGFYPLLLGVRSANVVVTLIGLIVPIYLIYPLLGDLRWKVLMPVVVGTVLGIPLGVWGLVRLDETVLMRALGIFIALYLGYDIFLKARLNYRTPSQMGYLAGVVGGAFAGAFTAGGPPVVAFLASLDLTKHQLKANILAFIVFATVYKVFFFAYHELMTWKMVIYAAVLLLPTFAGVIAGQKLFDRISTPLFQRVVQALLLTSALYMVVGA